MISSQKYEVVVTANLFCVGTTERQTAKTADIEAKQHPIPKQVAAYYHELQKISLKKNTLTANFKLHNTSSTNPTTLLLKCSKLWKSLTQIPINWCKISYINSMSTYDQSTYATIQTFC